MVKRWYAGRSFIIYSIAFCVVTFSLCYLMRNWLYTLGDHRLYLDPLVAPSLGDHAAAVVRTHVWYNPQRIADDVQKKIPHAQAISVANKPLNLVEVDVAVQQPLYLVNKNFVITDTHIVVPANWYAPDALTHLPHLTVAACDADGVPVVDYAVLFALAHVPSSIWDHYRLSLIDAVDAYLFDQHQRQFVIRFNAQALPTDQLLATCAAVKDQIFKDKKFFLTQRPAKNLHDRIFVADIRFANQIIVYEHKRGTEGWVSC